MLDGKDSSGAPLGISPDDELCAALRRFSLERDRLMSLTARNTGISIAELNAMDALEAAGGEITPGELAARLSLSSGAVTALGDRLERAGWIARVPHPTDRRSVLMRLTRKAVQEGRRLLGAFSAEADAMAGEYAGADRRVVLRFLTAAAELAADQADRAASSSPGSVTGARHVKRSQT